jgi:hypothetical protein
MLAVFRSTPIQPTQAALFFIASSFSQRKRKSLRNSPHGEMLPAARINYQLLTLPLDQFLILEHLEGPDEARLHQIIDAPVVS